MYLLTRTEERILLTVYLLGDEAYGISIRKHLENTIGRKYSVGAIYVPLERLTTKGFLISFSGEPLPERGGKRKRFYKITNQGLMALRKTKELHDVMWAAVPDLSAWEVPG